MRLILSRNQADVKGWFGGQKGVRFSVTAKAELTPKEKELCAKYLPGGDTLFSWEYRPRPGAQEITRHVTVDGLVNGQSFECESLLDIMSLEKGIIAGANNFHKYLDVANSFGGEISVNIPHEG